jgi:hypothetical protein
MAGLRRKSHYDEMLGALNPNVELPSRIATQIVDSQYFTRFIGAELDEGHAARTASGDMARAVGATAAARNAPLAELKVLVEGLTARPPPEPFTGQDEHEARRAQAELAARMADHQRGLVEVHRLAFTTRQAQSGLDAAHRASHQSITRIAEHQAIAAAQLAEMREQLKRQARRFANTFRAGASSSSASEPGAEE